MTQETDFDTVYYLGDSLTDSGSIFTLTSQVLNVPVPPVSAGYAGQFSNGDVYADVAPTLMGVETVVNLAVGGARALGSRPLREFIQANNQAGQLVDNPDQAVLDTDTNFTAQVQRLLSSTQGQDLSKSAVSIFIGLNDYANFAPSSPETALAEATALVQQVVGTTLQTAAALAAAGVGTIIIQTLPPISFFAAAAQFSTPEATAFGDQIIAAHNQALDAGVTQLAAAGVPVEIVDFAAMTGEIMEDPTSFGFVAPLSTSKWLGTGSDPVIVDTPEGPEAVFAPNPAAEGFDDDQFLFWDLFHLSAATHDVLGAFQAASLTQNLQFLTGSDDILFGGRDRDVVFAKAGDDLVNLGRGDDTGFGGLGNDALYGGRGADIVNGGSGNDSVFGGAGNDVVAGGEGDDWLSGGSGNDILVDGLGSDKSFGGRGDDAFLYTEASLIGGQTGADNDLFIGGRGDDTLYLALTAETRALVEAELDDGPIQHLHSIGLTTIGIEDFVFVDARTDLAAIESSARLTEADLWGVV